MLAVVEDWMLISNATYYIYLEEQDTLPEYDEGRRVREKRYEEERTARSKKCYLMMDCP